jgi:hypothetical protein
MKEQCPMTWRKRIKCHEAPCTPKMTSLYFVGNAMGPDENKKKQIKLPPKN